MCGVATGGPLNYGPMDALLVLGDVSVSKEVRRRRARGLQKLGKIFQGEIPKCARSASQALRADGQGSSA